MQRLNRDQTRRSRLLAIAGALCLFSTVPARAQPDLLAKVTGFAQKAAAAHEKQDYAACLENLENALKLLSDAPRMTYRSAGALALLGRKAEAIERLNRVVDMGLGMDAAENPDFASLRGTPEFQAVLDKIAAAKKPSGSSAVAYRVNERELIPEGIAHDPATGKLYLSSIYERKIVEIAPDGTVRDFTKEGQDGFWSGLGMKVDAKRRVLWACSALDEGMKGFRREEAGASGVFKFDIATGKLIKKYLLDNKPEPHILNDLVLASEGDVFVTDSLTGSVLVIDHVKDAIDAFSEKGQFAGANGIALSQDEGRLFVAYGFGIAVLDRQTRKAFDLSRPSSTTLTGIDGLYLAGNKLVAVQTDLHRISTFTLNREQNGVESAGRLDSWNPLFEEPTTGVVAGDFFYYIANSQYNSYNEDGTLFPIDKLHEVVVLKSSLKP